ncbi:unnamed protein product [Enterobius vermicularis]|uniref:Methylmalonic aciduria and homocystinuria type D-like protein, mitochondrial n=1 Tax=Enterobius vermicularis TaxID=51028 RepID=A0A0N4VCH1_ENTVE|nr:unnamed protein product [Enterobius vermicularis]
MVGNARQIALRLRALTSLNEQLVTQQVQAPTVPSNNIVADKHFPLPGNVTSQATYSAVQGVPKVEVPVQSQITAMECPDDVLKTAQKLFPKQKLENVTVVNFVQKTESDMSEWSAKMEVEWTGLVSGIFWFTVADEKFQFNQTALQTCEMLHNLGYWADFVNPATGKAYISETKSDASLKTTDNEYRSLGFNIMDMGCCKILSHSVFGKHVFVGTLFTDAPTDVLARL